jgi:predicted permease
MFWRRREQDFDRELRDHLELEEGDHRDRGLSPEAARSAAQRALGNRTRIQEDVREVWGWGWLERLTQDVRYALRTLRWNPGFASVAVLALALGVGANTAIYSIVNAVYLRMLPVQRPEELVVVAARNESFSYPQFVHFRDHAATMQGVAAHHMMDFAVSARGSTDRVHGGIVSGNYFSVLGVQPALGSTIEPADDLTPRSGGARGPVVMIGYGYWMRRFGGDPAIVGKTIDVNGNPYVVAGVAPAGFDGTVVGEKAEIFVPLMTEPLVWPDNPNVFTGRRNVWLRLIGRRRMDLKLAAAAAEMTGLIQQFNQEDLLRPGLSENRRQILREERITLSAGSTGTSSLRRRFGSALSVVAVIAGLVLLIACANVANLLLTRATGRRKEIAVRLALGASRGRLIGQLLTESLVLALAGSVAGIVLARWVRDLLLRFLPQAAAVDTSFDREVLGFNLALGVGTGLLFGIVPALQSIRPDLSRSIKGGGAADGAIRFHFGKALVILQVALSLLLLSGAGVFLRSLRNLESIDPGFHNRNVLVFSVDPRTAGFTPEQGRALQSRLLDRVKSLPGVISATAADFAPLDNHTGRDLFVEGYQPTATEPTLSPGFGAVLPGYFATLGIPLVAGREFTAHDLTGSRTGIVNETFARHYFAGLNPVGRRIGFRKDLYDIEIVGVVRDGKYGSLRERPVRMLYMPGGQEPFFAANVFHLRTVGDPAALAPAVRSLVREMDPNIPVFGIATVQEQLDRGLAQDRLIATLCGIFSALALVLSAVGLYGVMSYWVSRRIREIGIRMALGATRGEILGEVVGEAFRLVAAGAAIGLPASYAAVKLVTSMLYGVQPEDPLSAMISVAILTAAAAIAVCIPARRAAGIDPMTALRYE